jgi:hypothetical protein
MDGAPDPGRTGVGDVSGPSSSTLPDYEDELEPGMENTARGGQENVMAFEEEFGMEVEPDLDECSLPKERSYSIRSNQSDSSVSEKAKKFIAENRPGPSKMKNTETRSADPLLMEILSAAIPPLPPAQKTRESGAKSSKNDGGGGTSASFPNESDCLDFPPQFYMIRAARNRSANVINLSNAFGVEREECCHGARDAGFKNDGDARCLAAMNFHRTDVNRNISASVTVELACLACDEPHFFRESILAGIPIVIVLTDQAFPPILPAKIKNVLSLSESRMASSLRSRTPLLTSLRISVHQRGGCRSEVSCFWDPCLTLVHEGWTAMLGTLLAACPQLVPRWDMGLK